MDFQKKFILKRDDASMDKDDNQVHRLLSQVPCNFLCVYSGSFVCLFLSLSTDASVFSSTNELDSSLSNKTSVGLSQIVFLNNFKRNTVCKASSQSCCHMLQLLEMAPQK